MKGPRYMAVGSMGVEPWLEVQRFESRAAAVDYAVYHLVPAFAEVRVIDREGARQIPEGLTILRWVRGVLVEQVIETASAETPGEST